MTPSIVTCLLILLFTQPDPASPAAPTCSVARADLVDDITYYLSVVDTSHAHPYRLIGRDALEKHATLIVARIGESGKNELSLPECYYYLQELAARIQDDHTQVVFPYRCLTPGQRFFPTCIKVIDDHVFVAKKWQDNEIPPFSELVAICGVPVKEMRARCKKFWNSDLAHAWDIQFESAFPLYLNSHFELHSPWSVTYVASGETRTASVDGIPGEELYYHVFMEDKAHTESTISVGDRIIPVLSIPNFAHGDETAFRKFVDGFFESHAQSEFVVIDLRHNTGGDGTRGYYLLDHLCESSYSTRNSFKFKISGLFKTSQYRSKAGDELSGAKDGSFIDSMRPKTRNRQYLGRAYQGVVFLLVSAETFSAGVVTAAIFQANEMGTVVGQETSGKHTFCSDPVIHRLPNTGLEVTVPVAVFALPGGHPDRGVIPDVIVDSSAEDLREHKDPELERVRELILKEGKRSVGSATQ